MKKMFDDQTATFGVFEVYQFVVTEKKFSYIYLSKLSVWEQLDESIT